MIRVARTPPSQALAAALDKRGASGLTEREASIWFHADVPPAFDPVPDPVPIKPGEAPEFKAYSDPAVKAELHLLFDGHCAYCESRYDHVSPMDVEHYRPKGAVIEEDGKLSKPGYYWLAADWDNLLPSCIGCNRARSQEQTLEDGTTVTATSGKANLFPLSDGCVRAKASGEEANERALLLDPCRDDPFQHLLFRSDGWVEPRAGVQEQAEPRGLATIEVCGLDRASLVESRRRAATRLREAMDSVLSADYDCRVHPGVPHYLRRRERKEADLEHLTDDLDYRALTGELRAVFAAARVMIDEYYKREATWLAEPTPENRVPFVTAARSIARLHSGAGLHQAFVTEIYGLADIPLERLGGG